MAKVYCFGNTTNGELGLGGIEEEHILTPRKQRLSHDRRKYTLVQVAAGRNHTLLLLRNITLEQNAVYSCGSNERLQLGRVGSWKKLEPVNGLAAHNIVQIACGTNHSLVLSDAGQLFAWGCNLFGQLGIGDRELQEIGKPLLVKKLASKSIVQIACGGNHCMALTKHGELYSWGSNAFGQLGIGSHGNCQSIPTLVDTLQWTPIRQIAAGGSHSAVLSYTGAIYFWGKNEFGQLGLNDQQNRFLPTLQMSLRHQKISYINLGEEHSAAITVDGGLFTWGAGMYGQLGHGRNTNEILPRKVFELMGNCITQVSCGRCHTMVSTKHGRVYTFGLNGSGQLGIGSTQSKFLPTHLDNGTWVEVNVKDLCIRNNQQSLCPVTGMPISSNTVVEQPQQQSTTTLDDVTNSQRFNVLSESTTPTTTTTTTADNNNRTENLSMEIDDVSEIDSCDATNEINPTEVIIEEPDDLEPSVRSASSISFMCKEDTVLKCRDQLEIDEYESDPDSDYDENPLQRKQTVLLEIIASRGDQSFVLTQPYAENVKPRDKRKLQPDKEISQLTTTTMEQFKDLPTDSVPLDTMDYIETVMCSIPCWNASFINTTAYVSNNKKMIELEVNKRKKLFEHLGLHNDTPLDTHYIDWEQAYAALYMVEDAQHERINELMINSFTKLVSIMPDLIYRSNNVRLDEEVLRIYLLLPLSHLFDLRDQVQDHQREMLLRLINSYAALMLALSDDAIKRLKLWWACMPKRFLKRYIKIFTYCIEATFYNKLIGDDGKDSDKLQFHRRLINCLEVLKMIYIVNKLTETVSYKEFYVTNISEMADLRFDYTMWLSNRNKGIPGMRKPYQKTNNQKIQEYYLCDFSFIFDAPAKNIILAVDSEIQQHIAAQSSMFNHMVAFTVDNRVLINPDHLCLLVSVNRKTILLETINLFSKLHDSEFKKPLKVRFEGEEAIDAGQGMKKEFFLLLMKEILDEKYGMFMEYKETHTIWFHHANHDDSVMYHLIGILCGLAIYNQVIIDLPFPLVLYKKILGQSLELEDLNYLDPILVKNLKEILASYNSVEEFDAIFGDMNFTITLNTYGTPVEYELCADGKSHLLTYENRQQYVDLYWKYLLESSVAKQFEAFYSGFNKVLGTDILAIFDAEELMQLVSGQEVADWEELETFTDYIPPFNKDHPTIRLFWKVFHSLQNEQKRKFLHFLSGADRIPILGLRALQFRIQAMKVSEDHLPVAHTCFNILDLPEAYESENAEEKMRSKLLKAIENSHGFALA